MSKFLVIRLTETRAFFCDFLGLEDGKEKPKSWDKAETTDKVETGMDDHIALSVEKSADLVQYMKDNSISYWDRLLADRPLYQVFVRDPNGVVLELNDYDPEIDKIEPMVVLGQDWVDFCRENKIVFVQTIYLMGKNQNVCIAPAKFDIRVMTFLFGNLTNLHDKIHRGLKISKL